MPTLAEAAWMDGSSNGEVPPELMRTIREALLEHEGQSVPALAQRVAHTWMVVQGALVDLELLGQAWTYEQDGVQMCEALDPDDQELA
jgi:hypothetical protein